MCIACRRRGPQSALLRLTVQRGDPPQAVVDVRRSRGEHPGIRAARVDDGVLSVGVGNATNVAVTLARPVTARLPRGPVEVTALRLYADDATALVKAARARLGHLLRE